MKEYTGRKATCNDCFHISVCREINTLQQSHNFVWYKAHSGCPHYLPFDDTARLLRYGEWIKPTLCSQEYCSQCGKIPKMIFGILPDYCPHCGTKMIKKEDDNR